MDEKLKEVFDVKLQKGEEATFETEEEFSNGKGDSIDE